MKTKQGDFIEIEYVGKVNNNVFDVTSEELAKKHNIHNPKTKYKPAIICLGYRDLLQGLDDQLIDKEINKQYTIEIPPEKGFGKRNPKLLKLLKTSVFAEHEINPMPGLQVNMDGLVGIIKTVSGGRTIVDFNHPLSGKNLTYEITIKKIITNPKEKVESILSLLGDESKVEVKNKETIITGSVKKEIQKKLSDEIKKRIKEITVVTFKEKQK